MPSSRFLALALIFLSLSAIGADRPVTPPRIAPFDVAWADAAALGEETLVAFVADGGLFARRLDRTASPIEPFPTLLDPEAAQYSRPRVVPSGTSWFVAWIAEGSKLRFTRLTGDSLEPVVERQAVLALLDAVATPSGIVLFVLEDSRELVALQLDNEGNVTRRVVLQRGVQAPELTAEAVGDEVIFAFRANGSFIGKLAADGSIQQSRTTAEFGSGLTSAAAGSTVMIAPVRTEPGLPAETAVVFVRSNLTVAAERVVENASSPAIASNGSQFVMTFARFLGSGLALAMAFDQDGHELSGPAPVGPEGGLSDALVWNGSAFIGLWKRSAGGGLIAQPFDAALRSFAGPSSVAVRAMSQKAVAIARGPVTLAVWVEQESRQIMAARIDPAGLSLDGEGFAVGSFLPDTEIDVDVAGSANGFVLVVSWVHRPTSTLEIHLRRLDSSGRPVGDMITRFFPLPVSDVGSSVALASDGRDFLLLYGGGRPGESAVIHPVLITSEFEFHHGAGVEVSEDFAISTLDLAWDGERYLAAWDDFVICPILCSSTNDLYGLFFDATGEPEGPPFEIVPQDEGGAWSTRLAFDGTRYLVTWRGWNGLGARFVERDGTVSGRLDVPFVPAGGSRHDVIGTGPGRFEIAVTGQTGVVLLEVVGSTVRAIRSGSEALRAIGADPSPRLFRSGAEAGVIYSSRQLEQPFLTASRLFARPPDRPGRADLSVAIEDAGDASAVVITNLGSEPATGVSVALSAGGPPLEATVDAEGGRCTLSSLGVVVCAFADPLPPGESRTVAIAAEPRSLRLAAFAIADQWDDQPENNSLSFDGSLYRVRRR